MRNGSYVKAALKEWDLKVDTDDPLENWAIEYLRWELPEAIEIMDERIRRVSAQITESWTEEETCRRYVGRATYEACVPVIKTLFESAAMSAEEIYDQQ